MSRRTLTRWQKTLIKSVFEVVTLLVAHAVLLRIMAAHDLASIIFSAGSHIPPGTLVLVGAFILVRLFVSLGLPGIVLARVGLVLVDMLSSER